jgi:hypothetical protein
MGKDGHTDDSFNTPTHKLTCNPPVASKELEQATTLE